MTVQVVLEDKVVSPSGSVRMTVQVELEAITLSGHQVQLA